jgi:small GTP-binding protein
MSAQTLQKIADIEQEMAKTQKNKATMAHLCLLKARLAKLKRELIAPTGSGGGAQERGFEVKRTGDSRVGLVGFPSVGKSTLLTTLTGTFSVAADYEFTTLTTVPGIIRYKGAKIQLLDLPGIIEGAKDGKGRGRQVIAVARTCNLILIVLDALKPLVHKQIIEKELEGFGIRLNKRNPDIKFARRDKGGITFSFGVPQTELDLDIVRSICTEYRVNSCDIRVNCDATADQIIDEIEGNRVYTPCLYVLNKIDQITIEELDILNRMPDVVPVSGFHKWNLDELLEKIWDKLDLIRIYPKPRGTIPDYSDPVVLRRADASVADFCDHIHKGILRDFKSALVWGSSVKFNPQKVGKEHILEDEDVVQIQKK